MLSPLSKSVRDVPGPSDSPTPDPNAFDPERHVRIDHRELSPEARRGLIEEFITRQGTDYGLVEASMGSKIRDVERQLDSGEANIFFDTLEECANILPRKLAP